MSTEDELRRLELERHAYLIEANEAVAPPQQIQWRLLNLEIAIYRALLTLEAGK